jgi:hypothetical protein
MKPGRDPTGASVRPSAKRSRGAVVAFDPPTELGNINELTERDIFWKLDNQYLIGSFSLSGHSISSHSSGRLLGSQ